MSDDGQRRPNPTEGGERKSVAHVLVEPPRKLDAASLPLAESPVHVNITLKKADAIDDEGMPNDKSDSEAETVVLSGPDEPHANQPAKAIKHENVENRNTPNGHYGGESDTRVGENGRPGAERPSLKRKRAVLGSSVSVGTEGGNSSNLSSTISSPALEARSSKKSDSGSDRSRSSPPCDEADLLDQDRVHKRKPGDDVDGHSRKQRGKSDPSSENIATKPGRGSRKAAHGASIHGSESPPPQTHKRALSLQSNGSELHVGNKRRKVPPNLNIDRRRKASEETRGDSDESSSIHDHSYLPKFASTVGHAISPAKMSHKKNRDKNGRTLLARACALDDVEAEMRLKERPQDLDIPDNAGNTPLQIASLEGKSKIVQLLLDAGCDLTCKNIDMETPLIDAVENGHLDVVKMLLKAGLDPRQSNAKGEEPLDLVNPENDHYDAIRAALIAAKEKDKLRRPSEDHNGPNASGRDNDTSSMGASAASPTESVPLQSARSPPPPLGARRRTARSQPTRDGLLWVNATPENLRDAAGKGDLAIVDHILKMRPRADSESVLAAARGGHEIVIELLIAIGRPDPDPDPLQSGDHKPAYSTPMLAAIGRGNVKVIQLLLNQPGFDPTRRLYKGMTYHEIAKERQSSDWEEEYKVLKEAYDSHMSHGAKKVNHGSPRKVRGKRPDSHKNNSETPSSPLLPSLEKASNAESTTLDDSKKIKRESESKVFHKRRRIPEAEPLEAQVIVSDRESETFGPPNSKPKNVRSVSDVGSEGLKTSGTFKPRRKLLSRNDLESDQDTRRRASLSKSETISSKDKSRKTSGDSSEHRTKIKKEPSNESSTMNGETSKKRMYISLSPQASLTELSKQPDIIKKKKRRRVDSEGNVISHDHQPRLTQARALVANMVPDSKPSSSSSKNIPAAAPVAFMGASVPSPVFASPTSTVAVPPTPGATALVPVSGTDKTRPTTASQQGSKEPKMPGVTNPKQPSNDQAHAKEPLREAQPKGLLEADATHERAEVENVKTTPIREEVAEEASRAAREKEASIAESQRRAEEAERQLQTERAEEEARMAKKQREEEAAAEMERTRIEQERIRKEEEERRRAELDEQERQRKIRIQEEEEEKERQRRESLPNGLRHAAELSPEEARSLKEIRKWLPLRTVTTRQIDATCGEKVAMDLWIPNIQAAPILAITNLDLPQCMRMSLPSDSEQKIDFECLLHTIDSAWARRSLTLNQRGSLWRQCRNQLSQPAWRSGQYVDYATAIALDNESRPKFLALQTVFWIKLTDFMESVPQHPHLRDVKLTTSPVFMHEFPFGKGNGNGDGQGDGKGKGKDDGKGDGKGDGNGDSKGDVKGDGKGDGDGDGDGHRREASQASLAGGGLETQGSPPPPDTAMVNGV